ncbi:molybdopterin-dependent oxidoreductase [Amycolatopsis sp. FBCC-B4732]|nr:molybdopterin-dependent oxidoreductase [Amycolatopsis sp. FBCC-B4732]
MFGIPQTSARVISPFVGGAIGSGLRAWPHSTFAALAARETGRPVSGQPFSTRRLRECYDVGAREFDFAARVVNQLKRHPPPVLVANGDHDRMVPTKNTHDLARRLHDRFVAKTLEFLAR